MRTPACNTAANWLDRAYTRTMQTIHLSNRCGYSVEIMMGSSAIVNLSVVDRFKPETYVANYLAVDTKLVKNRCYAQ